MCLTNEADNVPLLAFVTESGPGERDASLSAECESQELLQCILGEIAEAAGTPQNWNLFRAVYGVREPTDAGSDCGLRLMRVSFEEGRGKFADSIELTSVFPSLEAALLTLGKYVLKRPAGNWPVLVVHVTRGGLKCSAEVERAAGFLKAACDLYGAPGVLYNILLDSEGALHFPEKGILGSETSGLVQTLFRMSSPVGRTGERVLQGMNVSCSASGRFFERVGSLTESLAGRYLGAAVGRMRSASGKLADSVEARAFLAPKEGDSFDNCDDVVSLHGQEQRFAISDGATTASYSAEWARALCRHAVECPPPRIPQDAAGLPSEVLEETAEGLRTWLSGALGYWEPEVPWERLVRPAMLNKARQGSGASLAGIELFGAGGRPGIRFRAWALGDSCIIHLRDGRVFSSRPMDASATFTHAPALVTTWPGLERKYLRFWQDWEAELAPDDTILMGTDAISECILGAFESGRGTEVLGWLQTVAECQEDAWDKFEEFVSARRRDGTMKNDDVALVVIRLRKHNG